MAAAIREDKGGDRISPNFFQIMLPTVVYSKPYFSSLFKRISRGKTLFKSRYITSTVFLLSTRPDSVIEGN